MSSSSDDWFRSDSWDDSAQALFWAKLNRARSSRSQYLRIKGLSLLHTNDPARIEAGRMLSQQVLDGYPDDLLQTSSAHYALGESFADECRFDMAKEHLRACLAIEATVSVRHGTELRLAEVLIQESADGSRAEVLDLLDAAASQHSPFPATAWRIQVARARVYERTGDPIRAASHASEALGLLASNDSPFPRHPGVGVIRPDQQTLNELRRIASN